MSETVPVLIDADSSSLVPKIAAKDARLAYEHLQPGVFETGDLLVTTGAGLSVSAAAGRGIVQNGTGANLPGRKYGIYNDAAKNSANFEAGGVPANASANPRLDAVVAQLWDHAVDASGQRKWRLVYVSGAAAPGAALGGTLPSLPATSLLLAEVLVPASNPTSIPGANIRDRRPWARGLALVADGLTSGPTTTSSTEATLAEMTLTGEFSGAMVEVAFTGEFVHSLTNNWILTRVSLDGAPNVPFIQDPVRRGTSPGTAGQPLTISNIQRFPISTPGRHTIEIVWATQGGTATANAKRRRLGVREILQVGVTT